MDKPQRNENIHSRKDLFFTVYYSQKEETTQISKDWINISHHGKLVSHKQKQTEWPLRRHGNQEGVRSTPAPSQAPPCHTQAVKRMTSSMTHSGPRCLQPQETWRPSSPRTGKDRSPGPPAPDCHTRVPHQREAVALGNNPQLLWRAHLDLDWASAPRRESWGPSSLWNHLLERGKRPLQEAWSWSWPWSLLRKNQAARPGGWCC